ncbi:arylesterase [Kaistia dalseonensis]|uniref:Acyl-CoA thioesterase-1 n=1 Tax=Kaistia dalseonensis TaxID=410840 RepID=A0ABU0H5V3_9HYPH|nr:arylesterase [Kaistia dalseonensis]MCX5494308.1 arylesterase [Kaistia dalseonensis]MDQ0436889.1 acyl-CoA thioesterase-1 [Kaistia dalseonensis]
MTIKSWLAAISLLCASTLCAPALAAPIRIVAFGDSLSAGYQLGPGEGFADQLQAALRAKGHDVTVVNASVSGDTTSAGLARLDWSIDPTANAVIVELGANDMLRGLDPTIPQKGLDTILARLKERGLPVLLAGMQAAPNLGADYATKFNAIYPELAEKYGAVLYPFFLDGVAAQPGLRLADGMHPNAAGVAVIVARILPSVEQLIAQVKP